MNNNIGTAEIDERARHRATLGKDTIMNNYPQTRNESSVKSHVPTWGEIGKSLLLETGRALIPHFPQFIYKILDYPIHMMDCGYEIRVTRDRTGKFDLRLGQNIFQQQAPIFDDWENEEDHCNE